jgi:hypothetical protein
MRSPSTRKTGHLSRISSAVSTSCSTPASLMASIESERSSSRPICRNPVRTLELLETERISSMLRTTSLTSSGSSSCTVTTPADLDAAPPSTPLGSTSVTRSPFSAAVSAAKAPTGPPPTTIRPLDTIRPLPAIDTCPLIEPVWGYSWLNLRCVSSSYFLYFSMMGHQSFSGQ